MAGSSGVRLPNNEVGSSGVRLPTNEHLVGSSGMRLNTNELVQHKQQEVKAPENSKCENCGKNAHFMCSACKATHYCSQTCQVRGKKK